MKFSANHFADCAEHKAQNNQERDKQESHKENPKSPFLTGYQIALKYLEEIGKEHKSFNLPLQVSEAEYNMIKAILCSQIDDESDLRQTINGVDCPTICMVFRTMICFNDSLLANKFNYDEAKDTVKTIFKLCVKCAV